MNSYDMVEIYRAITSESQKYFDGLVTSVDERIADIAKTEAERKVFDSLKYAASASITKSEQSDAQGIEYTQYATRTAVARIYSNHPPGYVYCEIEQHVPRSGKRKCFAIKSGPKTFSGADIKLVGTLDGIDYPGYSSIADFIVKSLFTGTISEDMLQRREAFLEEAV